MRASCLPALCAALATFGSTAVADANVVYAGVLGALGVDTFGSGLPAMLA